MEIPIPTQKKGKGGSSSKKPSRLSNLAGSKGILTKSENIASLNGLGSLSPNPSNSLNTAAAVLDYFHNATVQGALYIEIFFGVIYLDI